MTRVQRRRHLAMWCVIGPAAMLLIIVAVAVRPARLISGTNGTSRSTDPVSQNGGRP